MLRALLNRWRRRLAHLLLHRTVFGEAQAGRRLPHTRIAPSSCIVEAGGLHLGDHVYIGPFNLLDASGGLAVGEGVQITSHCSIVTHSSHRALRLQGRAYAGHAHPAGPRPGWIEGSVSIGPYSFIGPHSLIEAGTRLGRGTLVCAGSVVRGAFPDFAVLRGNPAQVVGDTRQTDEALLHQHPAWRAHYEAWAHQAPPPLRLVLIGDGQSPHLLKWGRTLKAVGGSDVDLFVLSSRGLLPQWAEVLEASKCLLLNTRPRQEGGNADLLRHLPRAAAWLRAIRPDVLHAHYLTSHGTLAWLARRFMGVPGELVTSAWGSDVLVTPERSAAARMLTSAVLRASRLSTADSQHMADRMRQLGAARIRVFPFGLETLPSPRFEDVESAGGEAASGESLPGEDRFFSNRGLEPLYRIDAVLRFFAAVAAHRPQATLVVANRGGSEAALRDLAAALGVQDRVTFVGLLDAAEQAQAYRQATWHLSLPRSDSVSVSVLEAMAHGCIPLLSDLPANRELVQDGLNGLILPDDPEQAAARFLAHREGLWARHIEIEARNRTWVAEHGLFAPHVRRFLAELRP